VSACPSSWPTTATVRGAGVGLANLRGRLQALYGEAASLTLRPHEGGGSVAVLELPVRHE
jgi:sensor histidine kinase YesM